MAVTRRRTMLVLIPAAALVLLLAYLRDPPWLIRVTAGLGPVRTEASGVRYRRMEGRGSFFVPADAESVVIPVRAPFRTASDWPIAATFFVDDRPVNRIVLTDGGWQRVTLPLRRESRRRFRRIDIHADRTRAWNHALDLGPAELLTR